MSTACARKTVTITRELFAMANTSVLDGTMTKSAKKSPGIPKTCIGKNAIVASNTPHTLFTAAYLDLPTSRPLWEPWLSEQSP